MHTPSAEPHLTALPELRATYAETRATVLEAGVIDDRLKELCSRYLADEPDVHGADEREQAALQWARSVAWDSDAADAELWERLHANFSEHELVELGYFIAFTLGQQHWLGTLAAREGG
jgi:alkylhydroperoxidase family enzyme